MRMNFVDMLSYRADLFLFITSGAIGPVVMILIWLAVYASGGNPTISQAEMVQYYVFLLVIELWNSAWASSFIATEIRTGKMTMYLVKPMSVYWYRVFESTSSKVFKSAYLIPIVLLLIFLLKVSIPTLSLGMLALFIFSWVFSAAITLTLDFILGISAFWIDDNGSLQAFYDLLYFIFSGRLIPLFLLSTQIQNLAGILPFRYMLSFPLEVLLGKITQEGLLVGIISQILWLITIVVIAQLLWRKGVRKYAAYG